MCGLRLIDSDKFTFIFAVVRRCFALAILLGVASTAQNSSTLPAQMKPEPQTKSQKANQPKQDVQSIADGADGIPPEFGADILIRLSESSKVTSRAAKIDLLQRAFYLGAKAEPIIKRSPMSGISTDTRVGYEAISSHLNLERISLQSRAVTGMLPLNAAEARELFEQIRLPDLAPLGCQESSSYDLRGFYETLANVARSGFTSKDRLKGRDVALLSPYLGAIQSHAQVAPLARLLANADLSPSDLNRLSNTFAVALSQLQGDERSFAVWNSEDSKQGNAAGLVSDLINKLEAKGVPSIGLLSALRQYLVNNFDGVRCEDSVNDESEQGKSLPGRIQEFNQQFQEALRNAQLAPITKEDIKGDHIGPKATNIEFWNSPTSKQLDTDLRKLLWNNTRPLSNEEKNTPEWHSQLDDFLTEMEGWSPNGEPTEDFLAEKSILFWTVIDAVPNGPERYKVLYALVNFLEQSFDQGMSRNEWLFGVNRLLSGTVAADDRREVLEAFLNSRDSSLSLYAHLEVLDPRDTHHVPRR
jgi:hypothetical protein